MGQKTPKGESPQYQILQKCWELDQKKVTKSSQPSKVQGSLQLEIRKCFDAYDSNKSGALERDEAMTYINDFLK